MRVLRLERLSWRGRQLVIGASVAGYMFTTSVWYHDVDLDALAARLGEARMERLALHIALFEINRLVSLRPDVVELGLMEGAGERYATMSYAHAVYGAAGPQHALIRRAAGWARLAFALARSRGVDGEAMRMFEREVGAVDVAAVGERLWRVYGEEARWPARLSEPLLGRMSRVAEATRRRHGIVA